MRRGAVDPACSDVRVLDAEHAVPCGFCERQDHRIDAVHQAIDDIGGDLPADAADNGALEIAAAATQHFDHLDFCANDAAVAGLHRTLDCSTNASRCGTPCMR